MNQGKLDVPFEKIKSLVKLEELRVFLVCAFLICILQGVAFMQLPSDVSIFTYFLTIFGMGILFITVNITVVKSRVKKLQELINSQRRQMDCIKNIIFTAEKNQSVSASEIRKIWLTFLQEKRELSS